MLPSRIQRVNFRDSLVALLDQITSCYSAFSHSAAETQAIYDVLERCRGRTHEPEVVGTIARGWHAVCKLHLLFLRPPELPKIL